MASRTSSQGRRGGRSQPSSSPLPIVIGIAGAALIGVLLIANLGGSGGGADDGDAATPPAGSPPAAQQPQAPSAPKIQIGSAKAGKTPARPAPPLPEATLQRGAELLAEAKALSNEGVKARAAGDNQRAREQQSLAKDKIDEILKMLEAPALWQEEADMNDWAQPAEYVALQRLYGEISTLRNRVRKSGGT